MPQDVTDQITAGVTQVMNLIAAANGNCVGEYVLIATMQVDTDGNAVYEWRRYEEKRLREAAYYAALVATYLLDAMVLDHLAA